MIQIQGLTNNVFQENTYVLFDESKECVIIDPGVSNAREQAALDEIISSHGLKPVALLNTHCHVDHVLGNAYVAQKYKLELGIHRSDLVMLHAVVDRSMNFGIPYEPSPEPSYFLEHGQLFKFGNSELEVRFVPGHAPGHIVFVSHADGFVIAGDTLFRESIGRTDLPFGDFDKLEAAIKRELYTLPEHFVVWPGHGSETTIGHEIRHNPFVRLI